jgi:tRNA-uridine 2-sulfurtransferase
MKVLAALSGGVDSAVAAARAVDAGHDVTAVHLALSSTPAAQRSGSRGCCSLEDSRDARRVADRLGVPFYVWDVAERFREDVIDDFIAEYAAGRTPNPCLRCNERIKFSAVLERAVALGFDAVCTGHYARLVDTPDGRELHRAVDPDKDQSYVLAVLADWQIQRSMFPLGDTVKADVRIEAAARDLLVADKADSHDICFIPDGDTAGFLNRHIGERAGEIRDAVSGEVLGSHGGAHTFTIGQRRGIGVGGPSPDGGPRYVVDVNTSSGAVLVGPPTLLDVDRIEGGAPTWCGTPMSLPATLDVQVRAHGSTSPAEMTLENGDLVASLVDTIRGVAPGQAMVAYDGTRVVASTTIQRTRRTRRALGTPQVAPGVR